MSNSGQSSTEIDRQGLWGDYQDNRKKSLAWQDELQKQLAHKSLNIPDGGLEDVNVDNSVRGLGLRELTVIVAGMLGAAGAGAYVMQPSSPPPVVAPADPVQPQPAPSQPGPLDSEYEVRFYDSEGNLIRVPHISTKG